MFIQYNVTAEQINRRGSLWNAVSSVLVALQPVVLLMILTRSVSIEEAGIFTLANANANMFIAVGKFGVHTYQVSDQKHIYSDKEYLLSRRITCLLMVIVSILYIFVAASVNHYSYYKSTVIIWMCMFRMVDAVEDVYHGIYQRAGRLDIAAQCMSIRLIIVTLFYCAAVIISRNLLASTVSSTLLSALLVFILVKIVKSNYKSNNNSLYIEKIDDSSRQYTGILRDCLPIFLGTFLFVFLSNSPRYAIDSLMDDSGQAIFGFIMMPASVVELLNNFFVNPEIVEYSRLWKNSLIGQFNQKLRKQVMILAGVISVCLIGSWFAGIPLLSIMYHTDLSTYRLNLLIVMIGGGCLALANMMIVILTIIRRQRSIVPGYFLAVGLAFFLPYVLVKHYGILGASCSYLVIMAVLGISFSGIVVYYLGQKNAD